jgi:DNA-directed RNA polymerase subunit RPC12/RpoP
MDGKLSTDFMLWRNCLVGTSELRNATLKEMLTYNIQDVVLQEEVYLKLRPWAKSHPNMAIYADDTEIRCTNCGSDDVKENGEYVTSLGVYPAYKCGCCGAVAGRGRKKSIDSEKYHSLLMPVAR